MSAHTPGPWRICVDGNIANCIQANRGIRSFDGDDGFRTIATFQACEPSGIYQKERENALANARLIAAAPELLAALESIVAKCDAAGIGANPDTLREIAATAIAKARGQS